MGELDERAFERAMDEDLDEALTLLADLTGATDERLRELARPGRIAPVNIARTGVPRPWWRAGSPRRASSADGDVDLDASLDAIVAALNADHRGRRPDGGALEAADTRLCLLVDRSDR